MANLDKFLSENVQLSEFGFGVGGGKEVEVCCILFVCGVSLFSLVINPGVLHFMIHSIFVHKNHMHMFIWAK